MARESGSLQWKEARMSVGEGARRPVQVVAVFAVIGAIAAVLSPEIPDTADVRNLFSALVLVVAASMFAGARRMAEEVEALL
jgi:uncharacterized membrane protein YfcA